VIRPARRPPGGGAEEKGGQVFDGGEIHRARRRHEAGRVQSQERRADRHGDRDPRRTAREAARGHDRKRADGPCPDARHAVVGVAEQVAGGRRIGHLQDAQESVGDERRAHMREQRCAPERPRPRHHRKRHRDLGQHRELRPRLAVDEDAAQRQQPEPARDEIRRTEGQRAGERLVRDRRDARDQTDDHRDGEVRHEGEPGE
jgi:hypothetical protein